MNMFAKKCGKDTQAEHCGGNLRKRMQVQPGTVAVFLYLAYAFYITVSTWVDAGSFLLGNQLPAYGIGLVITALVALLWSRVCTIEFRRFRPSKVLWVCAVFLLLLTFFRGLMPDQAYDTLNYHLLGQQPFQSGFEDACAPGNFQLYGFALGDKMYYLPRLLLGYRAGSMFSGVILCLVLYQVSELLHLLCGTQLAELRQKYFSGPVTRWFAFVLREETWAFLAVFIHDSVMLLASYHVELFALPFLLEGVYQLLQPQADSKENAVHFVFCVGFLFAIKMTNIVFVLPMVVLYLIKIRKILKPGLFFLCLVIGFFPCAPYLLYNWVEFGNPVFPYYNTIFKSAYFPETDFRDERFGPRTPLEMLLWPFVMILLPEVRQTEIAMTWTGALAVGIASLLAVIVVLVRQLVRRAKMCWQILMLWVLVVVSFIMWESTTGISRYYLGGYILLTCLFVWFAAHYLVGKGIWGGVISVICGILVAIQPISVWQEYDQGWEWSFRKVTAQSIAENLPLLFRDRVEPVSEDRQGLSFFFTGYLSGLSQLVDPDAPVYRMEYLQDYLSGDQQAAVRAEANARLASGKAYSLCLSRKFNQEFVDSLSQYGMYADTLQVWDNPVFRAENEILAVALSPLQEGQTNALYTTPFTLPRNGGQYLTAHCYAQNHEKTLYLQLMDDAGNVVYTAPLAKDGTLALSIDLPQTESENLEWVLADDQGIPVEENGPTLMVLNPQFSG